MTAVDSWWQLIWKNSTVIYMYKLKFILVPNIISLGWFSYSSTVISCHLLLKTVGGWWQLMWKKFTGIFMYTLKLILVPKLSYLGWFSFSSIVISCHQLLTAVDSWWQLIWQKFDWNTYIHTKVYTCAAFQPFSLIFIFISCWQLKTADMKKIWLEFLCTD